MVVANKMQRLYHGETEEIQRGTEKFMILGKNDQRDSENPYSAPQAELHSLPKEIGQTQLYHSMDWKLTLLAWLIFFGGFPIICTVEYTMRHALGMQGLKHPAQAADVIWYCSHAVLAAISLYFLWLSTVSFSQIWKRCLIVSLQAAAAFVLYAWLCLMYVIYTGIDSL